MGKIVKFCSSCDEGFAEKFGFCPNCGASLQAFEMNPLAAEAPPVEEAVAAAPVEEVIAAPVAAEPVEVVAATVDEPILEISEPEAAVEPEMAAAPEPDEVVTEIVEEPVFEAPAPKAAAASAFVQTTPIDIDRIPVSLEAEHSTYADQGDFYVTVIEEKNVGTRNALLLGATGVMLFSLMTGLVYNIFSKDLEVGSISDDIFTAVLVEDIPMQTDEEQQKNKDDGGGGGGGRDENEEVTQGDLADQSKNPTRPPDAKVPRFDFELKTPPPQTEGNKTFDKKFDRWGDPNGRFTSFSNGTGTGGGQGSGTGTGQGSGRGTGAGSGTGSGYGNGIGNGNGGGSGDDEGGTNGPPPAVAKISTPLKIISKPKAMFTDAARQNNYQGSVTLKIVFLASGQIGSISSVRGAPYGLTESAIAAARRIVFEPQKINGYPVAVTKTFEYSFTLY